MRRTAPAAAAAAAAAGEDAPLELQFNLCSGRSGTVLTHGGEAVGSVKSKVAELLGIAAPCQQWVLGDDRILNFDGTDGADDDLCLCSAIHGLQDGTHIVVVHNGAEQLPPLPVKFRMELLTALHVAHVRCSSAYTMQYVITADMERGDVTVAPWRRNDHDVHKFQQRSGILESTTSHWMAGSDTSKAKIGKIDVLGRFVAGWQRIARPVVNEAERLWTAEGSSGSVKMSTSPARVFVLPDPECKEVFVDIPMRFGEGKAVINFTMSRLLLDASGQPIRTALTYSKPADFDEYYLTIEEDDKMGSAAGSLRA